MTEVLLLQPPALKPVEPPLALAILLAHLRNCGLKVAALDANLEAYLYLLDPARLTAQSNTRGNTSLTRALKHRDASLAQLRSHTTNHNFARYSTAVRYVNLLLSCWNSSNGVETLTLGDYRHRGLSAFDPADLERLARGQVSTLFANYFKAELVPQVEALSPRIIAISINYRHQAIPAFELTGLLRRALPQVKLVAGGGLISSWREPLQRLNLCLPPFDHLVFGPGEAPLAQLAQASDPQPHRHADPAQINFDPDFSFARLGEYFSPEPVLPLGTSRGCYWQRCLFCPEAAAPVQAYAALEPARVPHLLRKLATAHGCSTFQLTDNAIPVSSLKALAAAPETLAGLHWFGFVRFEAALEDADFVAQLARSGCRMLQLGLESGSQRVLDRLGKGINVQRVARVLANLATAGIASYVYIMLGTPHETEADAQMTLNFLRQHATQISFLNLAIMNLPCTSGLLDQPQDHGIITSQPRSDGQPLGLYRTFDSTSGWNRTAARRFLNQRLLGTPEIRRIVKRTPPLFTSNHAVFFTNNDHKEFHHV
jgi:hypothetical protein